MWPGLEAGSVSTHNWIWAFCSADSSSVRVPVGLWPEGTAALQPVTEKHYDRLPSRKISNLCVIKQQMPGDLICRYSVCNYRTQRKAANPHIWEAGMSKCDFFSFFCRNVVLLVGLPQINLCDFCDPQTFSFNASSRSKFSLNPVKCLNIQRGERHNVLFRHSERSFQTPVIPWHFL